MKHFITLVFILLSYLSYGQITGAQVLAFQGNVTTTVRNTLDVPAGQYWMIYNTTTAQLEVSDDTDTWSAFTAGTDDQTAAEVSIADAGALITATDVEGALQENRTAINLNTAKVGLTDGDKGDITVSGSGSTLAIDAAAVVASKIADGVISNSKLTDNSISGAKLLDNTIEEPNLEATNAPTDNHILSYDLATLGFTWVDPATLGGADNLGDHTATTNLNMADNDILDLNLLEITNTTGANTMSLNFIADSDTAWGLTPLGGSNIQYSFVSGGWTFPILDAADYFTANNVETALAELGAGIASGGDGDHSLSVENQSIPAATMRVIDTDAAGSSISFENATVEVMRIGDNNDAAVYVDAFEALPGGNGFVDFVSPFTLAPADTGVADPAAYDHAVIQDTGVPYYSDGVNWLSLLGIAGTIAGRTGTTITAAMIQTQAQYDSDGAPSSGEVVFISDAVDYAYPQIALSNLSTTLTTGTKKGMWIAPAAGTIESPANNGIMVTLDVPGTATGINIDINKNGSDIATTNLTTDATEASSDTAATDFALSSYTFARGDKFIFDMDAVPTGATGALLTLKVIYD